MRASSQASEQWSPLKARSILTPLSYGPERPRPPGRTRLSAASLSVFSMIRSTIETVRILVVDDDAAVRESLRRALRLEGFDVELAGDGAEALQLIEENGDDPDLVVLDVLMPNVDGLEVCRRLRRTGSRVPVLMLTARDEVRDRVAGLDAGADDYLVKPFALDELLARLRALLRRASVTGGDEILRVGDLQLNPDTHEVHRGPREIDLTQREFELLEYLMRNERIVISRQRLLHEVWGYDPFSTTNTIEVFLSNLRRKLEAGDESRLLHTMRGAGYVLRA